MSIIKTMETILESQVAQRIDFLEAMYGINCNIYKVKKNVYSNVYGKESGEELSQPIAKTLLITNDAFTPADSVSAGTLTEGWMYSNSKDLNVGDRVEVYRSDGRGRRFKIEGVYSLGTTTSVIKKYKIVSLGD